MTTRMTRSIAALLLGAASALGAGEALADEQADRAAATHFFDAGAQAYDAGQYLVAAEAFLKAHDLLKSPALLFSAAQAYRRQWLVDGAPDSLRRSVRLYREYLKSDPEGKRREDAVSALADLAPIEARLGRRRSSLAGEKSPASGDKPALVPIPVPGQTPPGDGGEPAENPGEDVGEPEAEAPKTTRILLSANPNDAEVSVDGKPFVHVPAVVEVQPGAHAVRVRASGYHEEDVSVDAVKAELVARHVALRPKEGRLRVRGTAGASVTVDGQLRAVLPMDGPLELAPGEHFVSIGRAGRVSFGKTITIERDREVEVSGDLTVTGQRIGAWATFGVGLAGVVATGVLTGFAVARDTAAAQIDAKRATGTLATSERDQFNTELTARNDFRIAAGITGGAAGLFLLGSAVLFNFDPAEALPLPSKRTETKSAPPRPEFTVGLMSAGMRLKF